MDNKRAATKCITDASFSAVAELLVLFNQKVNKTRGRVNSSRGMQSDALSKVFETNFYLDFFSVQFSRLGDERVDNVLREAFYIFTYCV